MQPAAISYELSRDQLLLLDEWCVALHASLGTDARCRAALRFLVPQIARGAQVWLNSETGTPHLAQSSGRFGGDFTAIDLPLHAGRHEIGMLRLCEVHEKCSGSDGFFTTLAGRLAQALHNAYLFSREQRVSLTFQNAAITTSLPDVAVAQFDAMYQAGRAEALVGGDWYDAFALPDGRIILSVGDVFGSGLNAAVAMVSVRQTLRGVANIHADPVLMLQAADRTIRVQYPERYVTAFVAVFDPVTQQCAYVNAGHPPPFLRFSEGDVSALHGGGLPLGVPDFNAHVRVNYVHLPQDSLLVLYTDGLTEASRDVMEGERALYKAIQDLSPTRPYLAQHIHDAVVGTHARDDVAILTMHVQAPPKTRRWRFDPRWSDVARRVRLELIAEMQGGASSASAFDLEVIFSELMANSVRYAPGTVELFLERRAQDIVLHLLDKGPGFQFVARLPNDLFSESGRGLYLISQLAGEFNVERRPGGGSHARIVLEQKEQSTS